MISKHLFRTLVTGGLLLSLAVAEATAFSASFQAEQSAPPQKSANPSQENAAPSAAKSPAQNHDATNTNQPAAAASNGVPKVPKAKSQEELNAYQRFMKEPNPTEQIKQIEDFLLNFPETELKEFAYQAATQAYQSKNDYEKVLTYGELTLVENENNLVALLILCSAIPERTEKNDLDRDQKLAQAEGYAKKALEALKNMPSPPSLNAEQWVQAKRDTESTPHASLGMIALIRENFPTAEEEFKLATQMAARPDPVTFYRLALCYSFEKKFDDALAALDRATEVGGVKISDAGGKARDLVAEARDYVVKSKAAAETPVSGTATVAPATTTSAGNHP